MTNVWKILIHTTLGRLRKKAGKRNYSSDMKGPLQQVQEAPRAVPEKTLGNAGRRRRIPPRSGHPCTPPLFAVGYPLTKPSKRGVKMTDSGGGNMTMGVILQGICVFCLWTGRSAHDDTGVRRSDYDYPRPRAFTLAQSIRASPHSSRMRCANKRYFFRADITPSLFRYRY